MKNALLSVSDKTGIELFAQKLERMGFRIISTGGTYQVLKNAGIKSLLEISEFTGFPEGLDGRIKTLVPQVFGGILNLHNNQEHQQFCERNHIEKIDLVVVNLYPFKDTYENKEKSFAEKVEQMDIGGPSLIRAAAKNYEFCTPVVDPEDYERIANEYAQNNDIPFELRKILAAKAFQMTAHYDLLIAKFWTENSGISDLRYGENPHQGAVLLHDPFTKGANLAQAKLLNGKPMSYNNFGDASAALELTLSFSHPFACIIKHGSPCCAALGRTADTAFMSAYEQGDKESAFGGIIAVNRTVGRKLAKHIINFFNEIVIAPSFDESALEILKKKKNLRVLEIPEWKEQTPDIVFKRIRGGTLIQDRDIKQLKKRNLKVITKKTPSKKELEDMIVAWKIVKILKSNAIAIVKDGILIGKGCGQTSRVQSIKLALEQAGERAAGAVLASDGFFPFADSITRAGKHGITAIIQPGGSLKDEEVFTEANAKNMAMVLTGTRAFLH